MRSHRATAIAGLLNLTDPYAHAGAGGLPRMRRTLGHASFAGKRMICINVDVPLALANFRDIDASARLRASRLQMYYRTPETVQRETTSLERGAGYGNLAEETYGVTCFIRGGFPRKAAARVALDCYRGRRVGTAASVATSPVRPRPRPPPVQSGFVQPGGVKQLEHFN